MIRGYRIAAMWVWTFLAASAFAGIWQDDFGGKQLAAGWKGDVDNFFPEDGEVNGVSAHPIMTFVRILEIDGNWRNYTVRCRVNVVSPNLAICSKGGLVLRHRGDRGILFALHVPTQTAEVFHLNTREMLRSVPIPLGWDEWHSLRVDDFDGTLTFYVDDRRIAAISLGLWTGATGIGVEDTMRTLFDDFRAEGLNVPNGGHGTARVEPAGKLAARWGRLKALTPQ